MKWHTTIGLVIAVGVAGAALWLADHEETLHHEAERPGGPLMAFEPEQVTKFQITSNGLEVSLIKEENQWFIVSPVRARADMGQVERLLGGLEALMREEVVTETQRTRLGLSLHDYGLDAPWGNWVIQAGEQRHALWAGLNSPLGNQLYVRLNDAPEVIATSRKLRDLAPSSVAELRDARILGGAEDRVTRVELHRPDQGFVRLARNEGQWQVQQPVVARADPARIHDLLDQLFNLRAVAYVWDPAEGGTNVEADAVAREEQYGLASDEAAARIQVWLDGDLVAYELIIGKPAAEGSDTRYAQRRDVSSVYAIRAPEFGWLTVGVNDLRQRELFGLEPANVQAVEFSMGERKLALQRDGAGAWRLVEPVPGKADPPAVSEMLQDLLRWRALEFAEGDEAAAATLALSNAFCTVRLSTNASAAAQIPMPMPLAPDLAIGVSNGAEVPLRVAFGAGVGAAAYAQFVGDATIYRLAPTAMRALGDNPCDPLQFWDRTMLSIPADNIQRLVLEKDGVRQTVSRKPIGGWESEVATNTVEEGVAEDALLLVANLRALRAEAQNPAALGLYGLDPPKAALTLGLTGETGIQKTILFGEGSRADGVFAMIKGQEIVFVLSKPLADLLQRDLVRSD